MAAEAWTTRGDRRLAAKIDGAADRLAEAVSAARSAGLKVYVYCPDSDEGELQITITVSRPIPLPSDSREPEE